MQFDSQYKRTILSQGILGFVPDAILALLVGFWFDQGVLVAAAIFVGLQVLNLVRWAVVAGLGWVYFHLLGRKKMASFFCDYLGSI
jgi:hypothetical protein